MVLNFDAPCAKTPAPGLRTRAEGFGLDAFGRPAHPPEAEAFARRLMGAGAEACAQLAVGEESIDGFGRRAVVVHVHQQGVRVVRQGKRTWRVTTRRTPERRAAGAASV